MKVHVRVLTISSMTSISSHICLYEICDMCIFSPINIYKQISNTSMYIFFSYKITGDSLHRVPLIQVLFCKESSGHWAITLKRFSLFKPFRE